MIDMPIIAQIYIGLIFIVVGALILDGRSIIERINRWGRHKK